MKVIHGDNIELLKQYPDNYFDAIVTDAPYGLGKEPNATELMKDWIDKGYHEVGGSGFMGKQWDAFVPQPLFWKEVFRVLKHGGHVLSFFGSRTYDWGVMAMRFAGFEVRDCITWHFGCLSDDTEILTKSGYIQYHNFKKLPNFEQQEILIYDIETDIYKWEKPERWNEYNIEQDTCYRIKSDSTDQIVSRNHRCVVEREGKLVFIQAEHLSQMEYMPTLSNDLSFIQKGYSEVLHEDLQRILSGSRLEETRTQREECVVGGNERELSVITNGGKQPIMERWDNLSEQERILFRSEIEICQMPTRVYSNVEEGWVCSGVSVSNGEAVEQTSIENGMCTSHRPQPNEQRYNESNAICNEQGTQTIRVGKSYSTTLATITPIEYSGVIFCPTVSTGCFVARRNGKIFITGNSGFPKSHNISKAIDKMYGAEREVVGKGKSGSSETHLKTMHSETKDGKSVFGGEYDITSASTDQAKQWEGYGSALKPASEYICMARKPLEKGLSIAENVLKWGTGAINIDGCRVGVDMANEGANAKRMDKTYKGKSAIWNNADSPTTFDCYSKGRFPANLILTHHPECECVGTKKVKGSNGGNSGTISNNVYGKFNGEKNNDGCGFADENGEETIEDWNCVEDCPIKILDQQSGESKSSQSMRGEGGGGNKVQQLNYRENSLRGHTDKGGASRFFYIAKASKSERNKGLEGMPLGEPPQTARSKPAEGRNNALGEERANFHPTVKPIKLMQYLVRLVTPPNGIVLDPFCGSGTTGIACKLEGFEFVGLEQDAEYCKIAQARMDNYVEEKEKSKKSIKPKEDNNFKQPTLF